MPRLSDPKLNIEVAAGSSNATVDASVDVSFSPAEKALIDLLGLRYKVTCRIRGADWPDPDNALFTLGNERVNSDRSNLPFSRVVPKGRLDEDGSSGDEVYARFTCTPPPDTGIALTSATPVNSAELSGGF